MTNLTEQSNNGTSLVSLKDLVVGRNVRTPRTEGIADLVASIKANGILQPLLVRPKGEQYELICGHRRLAAAREAGLEQVPVFARDLSDVDALAAQIVENLQREDSHALDEAESYRRLMTQAKLDVANIAARVGRSVPYVYDRLRLNDLTPEVKQLFRSDRITPGHAVVLARLKPEDQKRAIDARHGGLFEHESLLWNPSDENRPNFDAEEALKTKTVRELQGWVDKHVKFDPGAEDVPNLFPETAQALTVAKEQAEKIVPITHDHSIHPDARDGERVLGPRSWERADGKLGSKTCEHSILGVVVVGPGRSEVMRVCISKKACKVHFRQQRREAKQRQVAGSNGSAEAQSAKAEAARKAAYERAEAARARFKKAAPAIAKALAEVMAKQPAKGSGRLADLLVKDVRDWRNTKFASLLKPGKSAEDLVRYLAFMTVVTRLGDYDAAQEFPKVAKSFGIDVVKILDRVAPMEKATTAAKSKSAAGASAKDGAGDEGDEE